MICKLTWKIGQIKNELEKICETMHWKVASNLDNEKTEDLEKSGKYKKQSEFFGSFSWPKRKLEFLQNSSEFPDCQITWVDYINIDSK